MLSAPTIRVDSRIRVPHPRRDGVPGELARWGRAAGWGVARSAMLLALTTTKQKHFLFF
jgi:hypothetical protein